MASNPDPPASTTQVLGLEAFTIMALEAFTVMALEAFPVYGVLGIKIRTVCMAGQPRTN